VSTSVIEPGTRLAGRYRLEERFRQSGGSTLWKATDEILARAVAVRTFTPDFALIAEVVMAARSASRLTDPRLTQVFDADDSGEFAYVVSEWVVGTTLEELISTGGPMEPGRTATLLGEASEAIAAAHLAGLAHLRLTPRDLLWTTGNTVKILGLGVDAALTGTTVTDPALTDTRGLAHMLYLALTAHWPGSATCKLPVAPMIDGVPRPPHQVRPGVPHALDRIICRCLGIPDGQEPPLTTPAKLAAALSGVPRVPLPLFAGYPQGPPPSVTPRSAPADSQGTRAMPMSAPAPPTAPPLPPPVRSRPAPSYSGDSEGHGGRGGHRGQGGVDVRSVG
jgi:serine/threonine protein kinase